MNICINKKTTYSLLLLLGLIIADVSSVKAQWYRREKFNASKRYTSIGVMLNAMNYFGDLAPKESFVSTDIKFTRPNIGIIVSRKLGPHFSVRGSFAWGRLTGDDYVSQTTNQNAMFRYIRNLSFRNDIKELSISGSWDLVANRKIFYKRPKWTPYIHAGVAVFLHNPKAKLPGTTEWVALQPLGTEGQGIDGKKRYSLVQIAVPFGIGIRRKVTDRIDISFEIGLRYTFTDYIDDVSGNYPTQDVLAQMSPQAIAFSNRTIGLSQSGADRGIDPLASYLYGPNYTVAYDLAGSAYAVRGHSAGDQRGHANEKDQYLVTGFHLNYILFRGVRCPKF